MCESCFMGNGFLFTKLVHTPHRTVIYSFGKSQSMQPEFPEAASHNFRPHLRQIIHCVDACFLERECGFLTYPPQHRHRLRAKYLSILSAVQHSQAVGLLQFRGHLGYDFIFRDTD